MKNRVKILSVGIIIILFVALFCTSCFPKSKGDDLKDFGDLTFVSSGSDYKGDGEVYFEIVDSTIGDEDNKLYVKWVNETDKNLEHGTMFSVFRIEDGEKIDCDTIENRFYTLPLLLIFPDGFEEREYFMHGYDLSKEGTYRIEHKFTLDNDKNKEYTAFIEFSLEGTEENTYVDEKDESSMFISDFEYQFLRADGTGDGHMAVWRYAENRLSPISSIQFLPLVVIENNEQLDNFTEGTSEQFGYDEYLKEYYDITSKYDEKYFEDNALFITYVSEGSGSVRHEISRIYRKDGYVRVFVSRIVPEIGTCDMAGWLGFVEVKKEDIKDTAEFDAVIGSPEDF
ncbi:MAG: hypothetical protein E7621_02540 [Ruminococcaceae bacterium]|nr:hypothetical protein [Oscillospiraceae bacterium]